MSIATITKSRDCDGVARFTVTVPGCLSMSGIETEAEAIEFGKIWGTRVRVKRGQKWTEVLSHRDGMRAA